VSYEIVPSDPYLSAITSLIGPSSTTAQAQLGGAERPWCTLN